VRHIAATGWPSWALACVDPGDRIGYPITKAVNILFTYGSCPSPN
jgi:hypothetical protein